MKQKIMVSVKLFIASVAFSIYLYSCNMNDSNEPAATTTTGDEQQAVPVDTSMNNTPPVAIEDAPAKPNPAKKGLKGKLSATLEMPAAPDAKMVPDQYGVYPIVDIMASFPNGNKGLQDYFDTKLEYPDEANNAGVEGMVRVSFIVDEKGNVMEPMVIGARPGYGLEDEALNIIKKMPKWNPAQVNGKSVKTRLTLPIRFELN